MNVFSKYYDWLHGRWAAGTVEKLPLVGEQGKTNVPGVRIVGDLSGVPLLKFSSETGVQAVRAIIAEPTFSRERHSKAGDVVDIAIIGGGVSGMSAAMEAQKAGLSYVLFESSQSFHTVENFPKGKPIFTYPTDMTPVGGIQYGVKSSVRESLLEDMKAQVRDAGVEVTIGQISHVKKQGALTQVIHIEENGQEPKVTSALRTIVAIGRSGNFRQLGVPGEELDKVMNRLHDPRDFEGKKVVVVGGGDSAVEAAVSLAECGAEVTLSYRKPELNRPKPENVETLTALSSSKDAALTLALGTTPVEVTERSFSYRNGNGDVETVENDVVFAMIGREAPLDFFRRSGISIAGERDAKWALTACLSVLSFTFLYLWKGGDSNLDALGVGMWAWPGSMPQWIAGLGADWASLVQDRSGIVGTLAVSMKSRSFYYTLTYCILVTVFGVNRMRRRRTPYVRRQTLTLMAIQWLPLFIIPEILLPWL